MITHKATVLTTKATGHTHSLPHIVSSHTKSRTPHITHTHIKHDHSHRANHEGKAHPRMGHTHTQHSHQKDTHHTHNSHTKKTHHAHKHTEGKEHKHTEGKVHPNMGYTQLSQQRDTHLTSHTQWLDPAHRASHTSDYLQGTPPWPAQGPWEPSGAFGQGLTWAQPPGPRCTRRRSSREPGCPPTSPAAAPPPLGSQPCCTGRRTLFVPAACRPH
jgi:hypothetical protein